MAGKLFPGDTNDTTTTRRFVEGKSVKALTFTPILTTWKIHATLRLSSKSIYSSIIKIYLLILLREFNIYLILLRVFSDIIILLVIVLLMNYRDSIRKYRVSILSIMCSIINYMYGTAFRLCPILHRVAHPAASVLFWSVLPSYLRVACRSFTAPHSTA